MSFVTPSSVARSVGPRLEEGATRRDATRRERWVPAIGVAVFGATLGGVECTAWALRRWDPM
jgi:hypothetical protein